VQDQDADKEPSSDGNVASTHNDQRYRKLRPFELPDAVSRRTVTEPDSPAGTVAMHISSLGQRVGTTRPSNVAATYPCAPMNPLPDNVTLSPAVAASGERAASASVLEPELTTVVLVVDGAVVDVVVDVDEGVVLEVERDPLLAPP
jgi:hypothetical protein